MATRIPTAIGRVVPFYLGNYDEHTQYNKLDNVLYDGCTYVALRAVPVGVAPPAENYWQLTASKGDTGGVGTVNATAAAASVAYASASVNGDDPSAMNFDFYFGLPKGDTGDPAAIASAFASVSSLGPTEDPTVEVSISGDPTAAVLQFDFGIPSVAGAVAQVDSINPVSGNVQLYAVQYGRSQLLTDAQKSQACSNIGALPSGDYIATPSIKTVNHFLQYIGDNQWTTSKVDVFPSGGETGYYLRKTTNSTEWAPVQALPTGGTIGMPLVKRSDSNYDVTWGSFISTSEIDEIIEA